MILILILQFILFFLIVISLVFFTLYLISVFQNNRKFRFFLIFGIVMFIQLFLSNYISKLISIEVTEKIKNSEKITLIGNNIKKDLTSNKEKLKTIKKSSLKHSFEHFTYQLILSENENDIFLMKDKKTTNRYWLFYDKYIFSKYISVGFIEI